MEPLGGVAPVDPVDPWPGPLIDALATVPAVQLLIVSDPAPVAPVQPATVVGNPVLSGTPITLPPGIVI